MEKQDAVIFELPDAKKIKCLTCKFGQNGCTLTYCAKFKVKPNDVYYENADCPEYVGINLKDI